MNDFRPVTTIRYHVTALLLACLLGVTCASAQQAWTNIAIAHRTDCLVSDNSTRWTLCGLFTTKQETATAGGPQALEGYTVVAHDRGEVGLAMGTIGNIEVAGAGRTMEARSLQAGGVITGDGVMEHWSGLTLSVPKAVNGARGRIKRADYINFDNGWSIRPDGEQLLLCDPRDRCRSF